MKGGSANDLTKVPKYAAIAKIARTLPGVVEQFVFNRLWFRVGKKVFACWGGDVGRRIPARDKFAPDSPLEEAGFEPLVPHLEAGGLCRTGARNRCLF
jgi:hypothetical protein